MRRLSHVVLPVVISLASCKSRDGTINEIDGGATDATCHCEDDGIACTLERCGPAGDCQHVADDRLCVGAGPCSVGACDVGEGGCIDRPRPPGVVCGASAPFGGPPRGCQQGECLPGRIAQLAPFGTIELPGAARASPDGFSVLIERVDDRDGDGIDEIAVFSMPLNGSSFEELPGAVSLYSPATGQRLWTATGSKGGLYFGGRLSATGDLDGDSRADLLCFEEVDSAPAVVALDGSTGETLWRHEEPDASYVRLAPMGDHDGDGVDDVVVVLGSAIAILSGADGSILGAALGPYGPNVGSTPDIDGDGRDDLIADSEPGSHRIVVVISSDSFETLHSFDGYAGDAWFTGRTSDLDGDGWDDILITTSNGVWRFRDAWSLRGPTRLWEVEQPRSAPVTSFDLDGDGVRDLVGDGHLEDSDQGWVMRNIEGTSGVDGTRIFRFEPTDTEGVLAPIATDIAQIGDLDGDGTDDWAVGDELAGSRIFLYTSQVLYF